MLKRLTTIASLAGATALIPATPAAAEQHCGTVAANRQTVRVGVFAAGRVSCARARDVAKCYISGRGRLHQVGSRLSNVRDVIAWTGSAEFRPPSVVQRWTPVTLHATE